MSCTLLLSAAALAMAAWAGRSPRHVPMRRLVALSWGAFGAVFLVVATVFGGPAMLWQLPQWTLLLPVALLAWPPRQPHSGDGTACACIESTRRG
ncbi:hypothetical protein [Eleftheria terrae]|uniref:hypothetical protein n=1 Tax=Eleftheria terrae TaxID=1597781 RepID=UPI00263B2D9D|nr:hypothetical protein [Eleftheria terrae]WKB51859.1 hypothetical protein N7L95_18930 [Eleftheria terrae]